MQIYEDGEYLIVKKGTLLVPSMGDINISLTGSLGGARVYLKHKIDEDNVSVMLSDLIELDTVYRLADRDDSDIYLVVEQGSVYTGFKVSVSRKEIKTELDPVYEDDEPDTFPLKALKIYKGKNALVSYLYPFYIYENTKTGLGLEGTGGLKLLFNRYSTDEVIETRTHLSLDPTKTELRNIVNTYIAKESTETSISLITTETNLIEIVNRLPTTDSSNSFIDLAVNSSSLEDIVIRHTSNDTSDSSIDLNLTTSILETI